MAEAQGRQLAWFLHRPLFLDSPDEADTGYWSVKPEPRALLIELVRRYSVALVASGHLHKAHQTLRDGTQYIWAPASSFLVGPAIQPEMPGKKRLGAVLYELDGAVLRPSIVDVPGLSPYWIDEVIDEVYPSARRQTAPGRADIFFFVSVSLGASSVEDRKEHRDGGNTRSRRHPLADLCLPNEGLTSVFKRTLTAPNVEARYKDPANWPAELIAELGNDDGLSAANRCGERFGNDFRAIRKILDDFNPDLVLVWGDDQYENFREDIVPAFCLLGYDRDFELKPWANGNGGKPNRWDEPGDWELAAARPSRGGEIPRHRADRARHRHGLCL